MAAPHSSGPEPSPCGKAGARQTDHKARSLQPRAPLAASGQPHYLETRCGGSSQTAESLASTELPKMPRGPCGGSGLGGADCSSMWPPFQRQTGWGQQAGRSLMPRSPGARGGVEAPPEAGAPPGSAPLCWLSSHCEDWGPRDHGGVENLVVSPRCPQCLSTRMQKPTKAGLGLSSVTRHFQRSGSCVLRTKAPRLRLRHRRARPQLPWPSEELPISLPDSVNPAVRAQLPTLDRSPSPLGVLAWRRAVRGSARGRPRRGLCSASTRSLRPGSHDEHRRDRVPGARRR